MASLEDEGLPEVSKLIEFRDSMAIDMGIRSKWYCYVFHRDNDERPQQ